MKISIHHHCADFDSYRSARVKSMFNVESGANFDLDAELPIDGNDWQIGVIVGPSGSGKSSLGQKIWGKSALYNPSWSANEPIIDAIHPDKAFDHITAALASVGLGSVPTWLRPYKVLSNGEQFRANLARLILDAPEKAVIDEFSSVVDRQVAQIGAGAFAKAWRRQAGQVVLLTCHYDVLDWLQPDWVYDTNKQQFNRGWLRPRPCIELDIYQTDWRFWTLFEKHHYLKLPRAIASTNYVAMCQGELVAHLVMSTRPGMIEARACRLVVMPEWQGVGIGSRFLQAICELWLAGENRYNKAMRTLFHTSHPGLAATLRRNPAWTQVSGQLVGDNKKRSSIALSGSVIRHGKPPELIPGYGGHFRSIQGFRFLGRE